MGKIIDLNGLQEFLAELMNLVPWQKSAGDGSVALRPFSSGAYAEGTCSSAEKGGAAYGDYSHVDGPDCYVSGYASHAEGKEHGITNESPNGGTVGTGCHAEGIGNTIVGNYCHAEGSGNSISQNASSNVASHVEGSNNTVKGLYSHVEGSYNTCNGYYSHVEGQSNKCQSNYSHVQGYGNTAGINSAGSFVGGEGSEASDALRSFCHGYYIRNTSDYQFGFGRYNDYYLSSGCVGYFAYGVEGNGKQTQLTTAGQWTVQGSDERLKYDIENIEDNVINAMDSVPLRQFTWKQEKEENPIGTGVTNYGVIAQNVISALTENGLNYKTTALVDSGDENSYGMNYTNLLIAKCASYEKKLSRMENMLEKCLEKSKELSL